MIKIRSERGKNLSTEGLDSGFDVMAKGFARVKCNKLKSDVWFDKECNTVVVQPNETILIKTGVHLELPSPRKKRNWYGKAMGRYILEAQVRNRSGLSLKHNTYVKWGTIDNEYRGDCGVMFWNNSDKEFVIKKDDRIAQLVFVEIYKPIIGVGSVKVDDLSDTRRGSGNFGSTGI